jgi:hypothetical protein
VTTAIKELEDELGVALFEAARRRGFASELVSTGWDENGRGTLREAKKLDAA